MDIGGGWTPENVRFDALVENGSQHRVLAAYDERTISVGNGVKRGDVASVHF